MVIVRTTELNNRNIYLIANWGKLVLQIWVALFYYKFGQTLLQTGAALLLQIGKSTIANLGSYYKLGQLLLQNRAAITSHGRTYYKLGHNKNRRDLETCITLVSVTDSGTK